MTRYLITFADGASYVTLARDCEEAQDVAIEAMEDLGLVLEAVRSIKRVAA